MKPRGFSAIGEAEALGFLAGQPVTLIWGVGKAFAATLEGDGIRSIGQLQRMEKTDLMKRYGVMGSRLYHLSRGQDVREVDPDQDAKAFRPRPPSRSISPQLPISSRCFAPCRRRCRPG